VGKYPLKCVEVFDRVARRIERSGGVNFAEQALLTTQRQKLVKSAVVMANELRAKAILVFTRHGHMARYVSWMRPRFSPIYALCGNQDVAESLTLSWGVEPQVIAFDRHNPEKTIETGLKLLLDRGRILSGDTVVIISSIAAGEKSVDAVQMRVA
jgi:pyruvate kinase